MKLKRNLSLSAARTQRWSPAAALRVGQTSPALASDCSVRPRSPFDLLTTRTQRPVRIPIPLVTPRLVLRGDKAYLQALRAAELAAWNASGKFPIV